MSLITYPPNSYVALPWSGPPTNLTALPWFTADKVERIFAFSTNRQGNTSVAPGANMQFAPFTQVLPSPSVGLPIGYFVKTKAGFQLDSSLITAPVGTYADVFAVPAGAPKPTAFRAIVDSRFTYATPVFSAGAGSVSYQVSGGTFTTLNDFNAALAALTDAQIQSGKTPFTLTLTPATSAGCTLELTRATTMPRSYLRPITPGFTTLDGSTGAISIDASEGAAGINSLVALSTNTTLSFLNPTNGAEGELWVTNPSQSYTLTLPPGLGSTTLTPQLGGTLVIGWAYNGTTFSFIVVQQ